MKGTLSMNRKAVPVVVMRPPDENPQICVGLIEKGPMGHCVGIGVSASFPGASLCLMANIPPEEARAIAEMLINAADEAEAIGPSEPALQIAMGALQAIQAMSPGSELEQ